MRFLIKNPNKNLAKNFNKDLTNNYKICFVTRILYAFLSCGSLFQSILNLKAC